MVSSAQSIIDRQYSVANGNFPRLPLPKFNTYVLGNLRGGVGKTALAFNLAYLANDVLALDTCPQGILSYFFDNDYYSRTSTTAKDLILPYLAPALGKASHAAMFVGATNEHFAKRGAFYIPSSPELYLLPSQLMTALNQANALSASQKEDTARNILFSMKKEIEREINEIGNIKLKKCLIDTSPFFSGATQLSWYAADAMIIPVRVDQQSIKSLELLIETLKNPSSEFRKPYIENQMPKIQMVVLTHCGWSASPGSRNMPNRQTVLCIQKVFDILNRNKPLLSTDDPANHLFLLDDFLGAGRISSALSKPLELLEAGESKAIDGQKVIVTAAVEKCKHQLRFINSLLW